MDWLYYLLEANLYLLLFYGFYRLFLQNETFYNINRYFLLLTSVIAFALPIMQLGFLKPTPIIDNELFPPPILYTEEQLAKMTYAPVQESFNVTDWLYPIYLIIALGFAIKLSMSLFKIIHLWLKAKKAKTGKITLIELKEQTTAFSFFNLLFIHPHLAEKQTVLNHEMVHIKQKHSLDILFFELLQIICWFNPIIYFIKKDIKLLHEYIADELSSNSGIQKHEYAMFLIENSFGVVPTPLTNQIFNQSILKRRINMLNKKRTADWARLRLLLTVPLVGVMLCTSTMAFTKDYGYVDLLPEKSKTAETIQQEVPQEKEVKQTAPKAKTVKKDQVKFPPPIVQASGNDRFSPMYRKDKKTGQPLLSETRLIIINGKPVEDITKFYGVYNAKSIVYRTKEGSLKKYGEKGKNGAVEITGNDIKYFTVVTLPSAPPVEPPPPRQDKVRFPPPIVRPDKASGKTYYPPYKRDKDDKFISLEKRAIVVNGNVIVDKNQYYGTNEAEKIIYLNSADAIAKYGAEVGQFGAVEITGEKALNAFPPPIVKQDQVKFPPPIVKPDKKRLKSPPAVEPPPSGYKPSKAPRVVEKRNVTGALKREVDSAMKDRAPTITGLQTDRKVYAIRATSLTGTQASRRDTVRARPNLKLRGEVRTIRKIDSLQRKSN
ncbi:M56 family metallopeptidase [Pedobacter frigiditerrae]|uniref:M56 family metallopeptidase n=1 Tax=Pedobacter frigiditerrae TaxID=2530452 RepID=UPI00292F7BA2|nr:M56 family metallopeptidase [Pedobacter frigiditerrae]